MKSLIPPLAMTTADRLEDILRDHILNHSAGYEPGAQLSIQQLRREFAISSTPIQQALRTLAAEGLIEIRPYGGAKVRVLTPTDICQLTVAEAAIEVTAVRLCQGRFSAATIAALRQCLMASRQATTEGDLRAGYEGNVRFHLTLVAETGNEPLVEMRRQLANRMRVLTAYPGAYHFKPSLDEHERICEAASSGQADKLIALIADHYRQAAGRVFRTVSEGIAMLDGIGAERQPDPFALLM
ncbi:MAG: GntR family transcriptional regulator [Chloroflexi bacterium]|nr:GntR family transcriptional regulator [Chloroflexota bacterium]